MVVERFKVFFEKFAILRNGVSEDSTPNLPNYDRDIRFGDCVAYFSFLVLARVTNKVQTGVTGSFWLLLFNRLQKII